MMAKSISQESHKELLLEGRRQFLFQLSTAVAAVSAFGAESSKTAVPLPTIQLGQHCISRLVAGWNPIGGYSYLGPHTDRHMKEYFTTERTVQFLLDCERQGITAHQFSPIANTVEVLRQVREHSSKMQFICLHSGRSGVKEMAESTRPIAMAHHGGATDRFFREGKSREVHDYVKEVHDRGMLAGVSAHNPDCIKQVADEGWEVDFFMTCFYYITRNKNADTKVPSIATVEISHTFLESDPMAMTSVIRQVKQPCLGFKILAAGRMCASEARVKQAFKFAFDHIKPTDGIIVGMYPRFFDEIRANTQHTRDMGKVS
ncbi:MAG: hypothetical protein PHR77_04030 [Kiritimatiellae bacterium]|nr:hypothetical protein [Kiritimatiellia bacterium]MDD5519928.1 hypothetical protein [Kiritimatiellia bacterium]